MSAPEPSRTFIDDWAALPAADRRRIRRLVRLGRPVEPEEQSLAAEYARYQAQRPWFRRFWIWFVPGTFLALGAAAQIHALFVGAVIALAAQAVLTRRNVRRAASSTTARSAGPKRKKTSSRTSGSPSRT